MTLEFTPMPPIKPEDEAVVLQRHKTKILTLGEIPSPESQEFESFIEKVVALYADDENKKPEEFFRTLVETIYNLE